MNPNVPRQAHDLAREELQAELLATNLFRIVMVGFFAFVGTCLWVMWT